MSHDEHPTETLATLTTRSAELLAHPPAGQTTLVMGGVAQPVSEVAGKLQGYAALYQDDLDAERAYLTAHARRQAIEPEARALLGETAAALKVILGPASPELRPYAVTPTKARRPLTSEQQVVAVQKGRATRKARGTLGKKQKLLITGAPAAPTPPTAPTKP